MFKYALALVGLIAVASAQTMVELIGKHAGEFNKGFCLAFQDNTADTTTTCYASCQKTAAQIQKILTFSSYKGG